MGLGEWFSTFCTSLKVVGSGTISQRYKSIMKRLNTDFWNTTSDTSNSLYVGSYGRNTAIQGFSDLDMIFQLPDSQYEKYNNYSGNGQSALLQAVKQSIEKTYSTTYIRADGHSRCSRFPERNKDFFFRRNREYGNSGGTLFRRGHKRSSIQPALVQNLCHRPERNQPVPVIRLNNQTSCCSLRTLLQSMFLG